MDHSTATDLQFVPVSLPQPLHGSDILEDSVGGSGGIVQHPMRNAQGVDVTDLDAHHDDSSLQIQILDKHGGGPVESQVAHAMTGSGISGGEIGYADVIMADQVLAARANAKGFQLPELDTSLVDQEMKALSTRVGKIDHQARAQERVDEAFKTTMRQVGGVQDAMQALVEDKRETLANLRKEQDPFERERLKEHIQWINEELKTSREESSSAIQCAVNQGKFIADTGLDQLATAQDVVLAQQRKDVLAKADLAVHLQQKAVDGKIETHRKMVEHSCWTVERHAQAAANLAASHAKGIMKEAEGREYAKLKDLNVDKMAIANKHDQQLKDLDVEKQEEINSSNKKEMEQARANKVSQDKENLEADKQKRLAVMAAGEQKLLLDKKKFEAEMQRAQQKEDFNRIQSEHADAMNAYQTELRDVTERCWKAKQPMHITKQAPRIAKRPDGTQYVTEWEVSYRPK